MGADKEIRFQGFLCRKSRLAGAKTREGREIGFTGDLADAKRREGREIGDLLFIWIANPRSASKKHARGA